VVLIGTNTESGETSTHSEFVTVNEPIKLPVARFIVDDGEYIIPAEVRFSNSSSNADSFSWDFGDPESGGQNISSLRDPSHTYTKAGRYKIVLTCRNSRAEEASTHVEYLTIAEPAKIPVAYFSVDVGDAIVPVVASFSNTSEYTSDYSWDFGDPASGSQNSSTLKKPVQKPSPR